MISGTCLYIHETEFLMWWSFLYIFHIFYILYFSRRQWSSWNMLYIHETEFLMWWSYLYIFHIFYILYFLGDSDLWNILYIHETEFLMMILSVHFSYLLHFVLFMRQWFSWTFWIFMRQKLFHVIFMYNSWWTPFNETICYILYFLGDSDLMNMLYIHETEVLMMNLPIHFSYLLHFVLSRRQWSLEHFVFSWDRISHDDPSCTFFISSTFCTFHEAVIFMNILNIHETKLSCTTDKLHLMRQFATCCTF